MKLTDFIHLSPNVKLYKHESFHTIRYSGQIFSKTEVMKMIKEQVTQDVLSQVSKKETKERVVNLLDHFESIHPDKIFVPFSICLVGKKLN